MLDELGFERFVVSIKDSDPALVVEANLRFAQACPEIPVHLGVTEAGLPPDGIIKTRVAFEQLLSRGIRQKRVAGSVAPGGGRISRRLPSAENLSDRF